METSLLVVFGFYRAGGRQSPEQGYELPLKIQGVKQHGFSKALYTIPPFIPTGTDLALTVIIAEIMKRMQHCLDKDIPFPTTLFLQVDGGSENASKAFYGFMEY